MGERFRERNRVLKWLVSAAGAIFAVLAVIYLIESHRLPPAGAAKAPPKPVTVTIVPVTRP